MSDIHGKEIGLYAGLRELATAAFPKQCNLCGRRYESVADYVAQTGRVATGGTGLKQSIDDDGRVIVELYRNCVCGSTLMEAYEDRRDMSASGARRRALFGALLDQLVRQGLKRECAHAELLIVLRGGTSAILRPLLRIERTRKAD